jgi:hypothetical protein
VWILDGTLKCPSNVGAEETNMNLWKWAKLAATAQTVVLAGCVPTAMGPTVTATPGPGKALTDFAADQSTCGALVNQQMAPVVQATNNQVAGTALQNILTGTGNNAVAVNTQATATLQQQYDAAYSACMYAKGDNVPPYYMQPTYYAEPTETTPTQHVKRRVAQKPSSPTPTPTPTASGSGQASGSGFVVPAPTSAPVAGSGFVQPAPVQPASASGGFAVPPPASH